MKNATRPFVAMITEICEEEGISVESFSFDWIFRLCKNGVYQYIYGYQFGLNAASVHSICCDKSAASEVMGSFGIPNVEHWFFMSPVNQKYISDSGNWDILMKKLKEYGELVCKPNEESGGDQVFHVRNQYELEHAVYHIFQKSRSMAVSPYYEILNEYRAIVLKGEIKLLYAKQRPYVIGDGVRSIGSLLIEYVSKEGNGILNDKMPECDYTQILQEGERFYLNWKHNLGQGAKAVLVEQEDIKKKIEGIVAMVVEKMDIRFASIDIVACADGYRVLEINSGVMMEHFSLQDKKSYETAKSIYREAILEMFVSHDRGGGK